MPEIIDSLLLEIGLDPKDFKIGMEEALKNFSKTKDGATKHAKDIEASGKQAAQFFSSLKTEALGLLAIFTGGMGIKNFTESTIQTGTSLNNLSKNIGMSSQSIQAWQQAGKQMGGTGAEVLSTLERVTQMSAKYKVGLGGSPDRFNQAGGNLEELKKGPEAYLFEAGRVLRKLAKEQGRDIAYTLASEMLIDPTTFNALIDGKNGIASRIGENKKMFSLDTNDIENLSKLNKEFADFEARATSTGQILISTLAPQLEQVMGFFNRLGQYLVEHKDDIKKWAQGMVDGFRIITSDVEELAKKWNGKVNPAGKGVFGAKPQADNSPQEERMNKEGGGKTKEEMFAEIERKYGLEPGLLNAIHQEESGSGKNMISPKGAMGHFQFMPETAKQYGLKDPNNLEESADAAGRYLRDLSKQNGGDRHKILAGYNWGQGNLERKGLNNAPAETVNYMRDIDKMMGNQTTNNTTTVTTGPITINAKSADGKDVYTAFKERVSNKALVTQSETGVQ